MTGFNTLDSLYTRKMSVYYQSGRTPVTRDSPKLLSYIQCQPPVYIHRCLFVNWHYGSVTVLTVGSIYVIRNPWVPGHVYYNYFHSSFRNISSVLNFKRLIYSKKRGPIFLRISVRSISDLWILIFGCLRLSLSRIFDGKISLHFDLTVRPGLPSRDFR